MEVKAASIFTIVVVILGFGEIPVCRGSKQTRNPSIYSPAHQKQTPLTEVCELNLLDKKAKRCEVKYNFYLSEANSTEARTVSLWRYKLCLVRELESTKCDKDSIVVEKLRRRIIRFQKDLKKMEADQKLKPAPDSFIKNSKKSKLEDQTAIIGRKLLSVEKASNKHTCRKMDDIKAQIRCAEKFLETEKANEAVVQECKPVAEYSRCLSSNEISCLSPASSYFFQVLTRHMQNCAIYGAVGRIYGDCPPETESEIVVQLLKCTKRFIKAVESGNQKKYCREYFDYSFCQDNLVQLYCNPESKVNELVTTFYSQVSSNYSAICNAASGDRQETVIPVATDSSDKKPKKKAKRSNEKGKSKTTKNTKKTKKPSKAPQGKHKIKPMTKARPTVEPTEDETDELPSNLKAEWLDDHQEKQMPRNKKVKSLDAKPLELNYERKEYLYLHVPQEVVKRDLVLMAIDTEWFNAKKQCDEVEMRPIEESDILPEDALKVTMKIEEYLGIKVDFLWIASDKSKTCMRYSFVNRDEKEPKMETFGCAKSFARAMLLCTNIKHK